MLDRCKVIFADIHLLCCIISSLIAASSSPCVGQQWSNVYLEYIHTILDSSHAKVKVSLFSLWPSSPPTDASSLQPLSSPSHLLPQLTFCIFWHASPLEQNTLLENKAINRSMPAIKQNNTATTQEQHSSQTPHNTTKLSKSDIKTIALKWIFHHLRRCSCCSMPLQLLSLLLSKFDLRSCCCACRWWMPAYLYLLHHICHENTTRRQLTNSPYSHYSTVFLGYKRLPAFKSSWKHSISAISIHLSAKVWHRHPRQELKNLSLSRTNIMSSGLRQGVVCVVWLPTSVMHQVSQR